MADTEAKPAEGGVPKKKMLSAALVRRTAAIGPVCIVYQYSFVANNGDIYTSRPSRPPFGRQEHCAAPSPLAPCRVAPARLRATRADDWAFIYRLVMSFLDNMDGPLILRPLTQPQSFNSKRVYEHQFRFFDKDADGKINAKELLSILGTIGRNATEAQAKVTLARALCPGATPEHVSPTCQATVDEGARNTPAPHSCDGRVSILASESLPCPPGAPPPGSPGPPRRAGSAKERHGTPPRSGTSRRSTGTRTAQWTLRSSWS